MKHQLTFVAFFCATCLWAAIAAPPRVWARPPRRVSLQYTRAEDALACIDPVTLAHKVEAFTGPVLVLPSSADTALEAHVEAKSKTGFRVRIQLSREGETPHGERILEVDSPDCRSFDDALAFVIATTIDPDLVLERVGALFDPAATPPKQTLLEEVAQPTPTPTSAHAARADAPARRPKQRPQGAVPEERVESSPRALGFGFAASNELPAPALGPSVLGRVAVLRWLELGAGVRMMFGRSDRQLDAAGASTRQFSASLLACPRVGAGASVTALLCLGPELSVLRASGRGFNENHRVGNTTLGLLLRPELSLRISGALALRVSALVRMGARNRLTFAGGGRVHELFATPLVTVGGDLSVLWTF